VGTPALAAGASVRDPWIAKQANSLPVFLALTARVRAGEFFAHFENRSGKG
jgi:hypothetical protein